MIFRLDILYCHFGYSFLVDSFEIIFSYKDFGLFCLWTFLKLISLRHKVGPVGNRHAEIMLLVISLLHIHT